MKKCFKSNWEKLINIYRLCCLIADEKKNIYRILKDIYSPVARFYSNFNYARGLARWLDFGFASMTLGFRAPYFTVHLICVTLWSSKNLLMVRLFFRLGNQNPESE